MYIRIFLLIIFRYIERHLEVEWRIKKTLVCFKLFLAQHNQQSIIYVFVTGTELGVELN